MNDISKNDFKCLYSFLLTLTFCAGWDVTGHSLRNERKVGILEPGKESLTSCQESRTGIETNCQDVENWG